MAQVVQGLVQPASAIDFWEHLSAVLTDEVVLAEAQAVGMDWPEIADGRAKLVETRGLLIRLAVTEGWLMRGAARIMLDPDPQEALAAARPWIEDAQRQAFAATDPPASEPA
jgi:hypothetical protein